MEQEELERLLREVAGGRREPEQVARRLREEILGDGEGYAELEFAKVDVHRRLRVGEPETVYGAGKTPEQILAIVQRLRRAHPDRPALATRLSEAARELLRARCPDAEVDDDARAAAIGPPAPERAGRLAVVCAGTSDLPVAAEAAFSARTFGLNVELTADVGVAGLHRLLAARRELEKADCVIVVAGMDGALPSAVGGLISAPLIAVPTSVGYGAAFGGLAPLLTMLNSCAPGVSTVNIDNGFGAAVCAARIMRVGQGA